MGALGDLGGGLAALAPYLGAGALGPLARAHYAAAGRHAADLGRLRSLPVRSLRRLVPEAHAAVARSQKMRVTVGRIVHYSLARAGVPVDEEDIVAALVTRVHHEGVLIDLVAFAPHGFLFHTAIPHCDSPAPDCWHWPPRQEE